MIPFKYYTVKLNSNFIIDNMIYIYFYDNRFFFNNYASPIFFFALRVLILQPRDRTMI